MNLLAQLTAAAKTQRERTSRERQLDALKAGNDAKHAVMVARYKKAFGKRKITTLQLAEILGDSRTTVAKRVTELAEKGRITNAGKVPGRKTVLWKWAD